VFRGPERIGTGVTLRRFQEFIELLDEFEELSRVSFAGREFSDLPSLLLVFVAHVLTLFEERDRISNLTLFHQLILYWRTESESAKLP
jgi:hypothetical protein